MPLSSHLDRTSFVNKEFIIMKKEHYFVAGHSEYSILPMRVTNHSARFCLSIYPSHGAGDDMGGTVLNWFNVILYFQ